MDDRHQVESVGSFERSNLIIPEMFSLMRICRENCHLATGLVVAEDHHVLIDSRGRCRSIIHLVGPVEPNLDGPLPQRTPVVYTKTLEMNDAAESVFRGYKYPLVPHHRRTTPWSRQGNRPRPRGFIYSSRAIKTGSDSGPSRAAKPRPVILSGIDTIDQQHHGAGYYEDSF